MKVQFSTLAQWFDNDFAKNNFKTEFDDKIVSKLQRLKIVALNLLSVLARDAHVSPKSQEFTSRDQKIYVILHRSPKSRILFFEIIGWYTQAKTSQTPWRCGAQHV